jgi:MHS family proline/betaine transporter-like MFS transporter
LLLFKAAMVLLLTAQFAPLPMLMCNLFPTSVRFSGVGIGYNFCSILLGGSTPFVALFFTNLTHDPYVPAYMLIATALFSLIAFLTLKPNARREQHLLK